MREMKNIIRLMVISSDPQLRKVLRFCFDGWGFETVFERSGADLERVIKFSPDAVVVDVKNASPGELAICEKLKKDFATIYVPVITLIDKRHLRMKLLEMNRGVDDYLIKPPDPLELRVRIEMAVRRSKESFYASPLTGLPGGVVAEKVLRQKLKGSSPFVAGHLDIDNFKSFNDKYGYMKGDRVLMQTAYMLSSAVREWGAEDDFVGHIGGDDFIVVTTPERYNTVCSNFICMFDTVMPFHYSRSDREKGFINARARSGKMRKIPLISVTIALVMRGAPKEMTSMIALNERIAEVKKYLKTIEGSKYMADRRAISNNDHLKVQVFRNEEGLSGSYQPLGEILLERGLLSAEELDLALQTHWKRRAPLGEVLTDLGYLSGEELLNALRSQEEELKT